MSPKKPQPDYASGPGGALAVSAKQQDQTPLLSKEVERSDKSPSSKSPPSKSMSLREQKRRADDRSPSPARGGVTRSCRCDKICYLRMINYALDMLEGDTGEGLEGAPRRPNRAARLLCCLLITVSLVIGLYFSWGYISGAVMAGLGVIGSAFGPIFSGLSLPQLPDLTSMSPATMYASFSGFCVSSYLVMMDFVSKSYVWFMGGGLLPHEIMALPAAKPCMPWDVDCKLPPQVARAMDDVETCPDGLILAGGRATPVFGVGTLLFLFWLFYGVAIGADLFMEAIETITSQETVKYLPIPGGGKKRTLTVKVWNATVANLTLMALGSSAPEILLSVIEICGNSFYSGELGPSTIVGSAAFNLMVISAVCVIAIPDGEGRYIKQQSVFLLTAFFSLFAYVWLALILTYWTPNVITVNEGMLTLAAFPFLVYLAYLADTGAIMSGGGDGQGGGASSAAATTSNAPRQVEIVGSAGFASAIVRTAAWYRMNATRQAVGGAGTEKWKARKDEREAREKEARLASKAALKFKTAALEEGGEASGGKGVGKSKKGGKGGGAPSAALLKETSSSKAHKYTSSDESSIEIGGSHFAVRSGDNWIDVPIFRSGGSVTADSVAFVVTSVTATAAGAAGGADGGEGGGKASAVTEGRIHFEPSQQSVTLRVHLQPEDTMGGGHDAAGGAALTVTLRDPSHGVKLGERVKATVNVVSTEAPGVLCLDEDQVRVHESTGVAVLTVRREEGTRGVIGCTVSTKDGTAVAPADYDPIEGLQLSFADGETEKTVSVTVHNDTHFEGDETLQVLLTDATGGATFSSNCDGGPERAVATVTIQCDDAASAGPCDALLVSIGINADLWHQVGLDWLHQLEDAVKYDGDDCSFSRAGISAILFFLLAVPWRLGFALAPPPRLFGGWACFMIALVFIGGLTALVGDAAGTLGCCMGISKSVTAITFVALGTSLPDTFASMSAATSEPHADNSLGNITGSNSVNVFLGLGLPWAIAAIYWSYMGTGGALEAEWRAKYEKEAWYTADMPVSFAVPAGSLGFSVIVFTGCAILTLATLFLRRSMLGYELGGPAPIARATAVFFVALWLVYIFLSIWQEGQAPA